MTVTVEDGTGVEVSSAREKKIETQASVDVTPTHRRKQCSARTLRDSERKRQTGGSDKLGFQACGCFDFLNEQRHRVLQVFPIDPTEDSAQERTRPTTDIHRKANRRLAGLSLRENVIVKNL